MKNAVIFASIILGLTACGDSGTDAEHLVVNPDFISEDGIDFRKCSNGNVYSYGSSQCYTLNEDSGQYESDTGTETEGDCCGDSKANVEVADHN